MKLFIYSRASRGPSLGSIYLFQVDRDLSLFFRSNDVAKSVENVYNISTLVEFDAFSNIPTFFKDFFDVEKCVRWVWGFMF